MKKVKVMFSSFPDFSSNAKPLYMYMKNKYGDKFELSWAVNDSSNQEKLRNVGINAYRIGTDEYFSYAKEVDIFFTTHCNILGEKNEKSIYVELWHGIGPKDLGYLTDNMNEKDKNWYESISRNVDYVITPSDFWRVIFATEFNIEYSRTLNFAYPKLDFFAYSNGKENLEKVTNLKLDKYKKIIFYMPTFRKGCDREQESSLNQNNIFNLEPYQEENLVEFLKQNDYLLCIKKHPSEELNTVDLQNENIKIIKEEDLINNNITINEILNASDLMITDYSSLGVEYLFFNKPVIYINTDAEEYSQNRGIIFGNSDFWMVGDKVHQIDGLLSSIDSALQSDYKPSEEYLQKKQLWFGDLKDGGCENICNYFFNGYKLNKDLVRHVDYIKLYKDRVDEVSKILDEKNEVIADRENRIKELDIFISNIINSKGWKFLEKIRGVKKVFKKKN